MRRLRNGFTLVEVLIALLLLSATALALTQTLLGTQHTRAVGEKWMHATQLAVEGIERFRAGHALGAVPPNGGFERSGDVTPWDGHPGLYRLEVTVSWNDGEPRRLQLITLARR
jgi:prepilin-type N-terminal cleavage/methylation domain-containing protein